ncbi:MAG: class I SAM-dependent methyltransferase [Saprospiraceae bacterium]|nr:class I SAM-dependent methyltransferase [Saprospiraceae bacterium]
MKDNFSTQSTQYAQFRPGYPAELYDFLFSQCLHFDRAWDCATGNGQMAVALATRFQRVDATDISENQLKNAAQRPNIRYQTGRAEEPDFPAHSMDLITVGQAAHWFDFDLFYPAIRRVLKPGGILALIGYNLLIVNENIDKVINHFYRQTLANCWDPERGLVEQAYQTIPFPLEEIPLPEMASRYLWTVDDLIGYLSTWSAVQHYIKKEGKSPLDESFMERIKSVWPDGVQHTVQFPIFGRTGRI